MSNRHNQRRQGKGLKHKQRPPLLTRLEQSARDKKLAIKMKAWGGR